MLVEPFRLGDTPCLAVPLAGSTVANEAASPITLISPCGVREREGMGRARLAARGGPVSG